MSPLVQRHVRKAARDDRGATAVEFALLFCFVFLPVCFGSISGGIVFSDKLALTQGAREASRYGATLPFTTGTQEAWLGKVLDTARVAGYGQMGTGDVTVCAALDTGPLPTDITHVRSQIGTSPMSSVTSSTSAKCPGTDTAAQPLPPGPHVVVTVVKQARLDVLVQDLTFQIDSMAVARFEGKL